MDVGVRVQGAHEPCAANVVGALAAAHGDAAEAVDGALPLGAVVRLGATEGVAYLVQERAHDVLAGQLAGGGPRVGRDARGEGRARRGLRGEGLARGRPRAG